MTQYCIFIYFVYDFSYSGYSPRRRVTILWSSSVLRRSYQNINIIQLYWEKNMTKSFQLVQNIYLWIEIYQINCMTFIIHKILFAWWTIYSWVLDKDDWWVVQINMWKLVDIAWIKIFHILLNCFLEV